MRDNRRFQKRSAVYECSNCRRQTRETGLGESGCRLCAYCYEEGGLENSVSDGIISEAEFNASIEALKARYNR